MRVGAIVRTMRRRFVPPILRLLFLLPFAVPLNCDAPNFAVGAATFPTAALHAPHSFLQGSWLYNLSICKALVPAAAADGGLCKGPANAFQITSGEGAACYALGVGEPALRMRPGTTRPQLRFGGGTPCGARGVPRSFTVELMCSVGAFSEMVAVTEARTGCHYKALVASPAGCAAECPLDAATRLPCGGPSRGRCVATDGAAGCVCLKEGAGPNCEGPERPAATRAGVAPFQVGGGGSISASALSALPLLTLAVFTLVRTGKCRAYRAAAPCAHSSAGALAMLATMALRGAPPLHGGPAAPPPPLHRHTHPAHAPLSRAIAPVVLPPYVSGVVINIGPYIDPPVPPGEHTAVIAVEPILKTAGLIPHHYNTFIVTAAVSDTVGLGRMAAYNHGQSSSLSEARPGDDADAGESYWAKEEHQGGWPAFNLVPVITLEHLLAAIPENVTILSVATDMQGHDLKAAKSASLPALRRVRRYKAEVYCGAFDGGYGVEDNSAAEWKEHMESAGFRELVGCPGPTSGRVYIGEMDCEWERVD